MSDTNVTDSGRQAYGSGDYNPQGRAAKAASAAKSAGAGSSVVSLDGSSGSGSKGSQAQKELQPKKGDPSAVDSTNNPAGNAKSAIGNQGQTGSDELGNTKKIADRKV